MKFKRIRHIIISVLLLAGISAHGQQDPMFTQYMNNPVLINPAYAGSFGHLNFNGIFRKQWVGLEWQPTTTSLSVASPFFEYQVGIGFTFLHDEIGPLSQTGVYMDYAYHIDYGPESRLSLGLKAGFNFYQKDLRDLITHEFDSWVANSPLDSKFLFNSGIGVYYYNQHFFAGLSVPKLFRNSLSNYENTYEVVGKEERHVFVTAGSIFDVNTITKFKPTAMFRMVNGAPFSGEITGTLIFYERLWAGLMYRFGDALGAHFRFEIQEGLQIGYSYDLNNSRLKEYNIGTHELFFTYTIVPRGQRILSPRYF
jgi:type IX secretion system PorP/SprF family membrane protein